MNLKLPDLRVKSPGKWLWAVLAVVPSLVALKGIFNFSRLFYVRDLGNYFYPNYLWVRRTVLDGYLPLWNPDSGAGYAMVSDPSFQLFFLPTLPLRLLLPETVGFNMMVAFPFPLAAIGTYLFLRRHASRPAAALGAIIFSVSGPLLSTANSLNPSTTAALIPWLLWATDRLFERISGRRIAVLAVLFALGFFAGQPDLLAWAAILVTLYAGLAVRQDQETWRLKLRRSALVGGCGVLGLLLSAIQFLPLLDATSRSHRGSGAMADGWSVHPLSFAEMLMPRVFGSSLDPVAQFNPWLYHLNGGREPYLISLYLGVAALLVALTGARMGEPRRWAKFWSILFGIAGVLALGYFTPLYGWLRAAIPVIGYFRYPSKLTIFMALAVAALAALGFDAVRSFGEKTAAKKRAMWIPLIAGISVAMVAAVLSALTIFSPQTIGEWLSTFSHHMQFDSSAYGVGRLVFELKQSAPRLFGLAACASFLLYLSVSQRKERHLALHLLFATIVLDLLFANVALNPTIPQTETSQPPWVAEIRTHTGERIFIDDQSPLSPAPQAPEFKFHYPPDYSLAKTDTIFHVNFPYNPIKYGLRDAVIVDVTKLRPREYTQMIKLFRGKDADARTRFLRRSGVRYFLQPRPAPAESRSVATVTTWFTGEQMLLYESDATEPRVAIAKEARVEPDMETQLERLFDADFDPAKEVLIDAEAPALVGKRGDAPQTAEALITSETPNSLTVKASVPEGGGYLLLRDSYDPNWRVEVDGVDAQLLRANVLYRTVRLEPGEHTVHFAYRPRPLYFGALISGITALALIFLSLRRFDRRTAKEPN